MDDLTKHWSSLSLSEREGSGLRLKREQAVEDFTIAARFFTKRTLNIEAIARTFSPLWRSKNGFSIKNNGDHTILFSFDNEVEVDKILSTEPWCFDKHIMALSKIRKESSLVECNFNNVSFWVQVYDIPLRYRNKEVAEQICETLGVIQHPRDPYDWDGGSFIRVRVSIDISLPLCRGRLITMDDNNEHWVSFKYERLPNLCYWCGRLTHIDKDCEKWFESEGSLQPDDQQFGAWLRAPPFIASRKNVVAVPGFYAKKKMASPAQNAPASSSRPNKQNLPLVSEAGNTRPMTINAPCASMGSHTFHGDTTTVLDNSDLTDVDVVQTPTPQEDFEHLIQEIDKDINLFECGKVNDGPLDVKGQENLAEGEAQPFIHSSTDTEQTQGQPTQPTKVCDITNQGPQIHLTRAQEGRKWTRILRPPTFSESQVSSSIIGKRSLPSFPEHKSPTKRRAIEAPLSDENPTPTAAADPQPRRQQ